MNKAVLQRRGALAGRKTEARPAVAERFAFSCIRSDINYDPVRLTVTECRSFSFNTEVTLFLLKWIKTYTQSASKCHDIKTHIQLYF